MKKQSKGWGIASLVLGLISVVWIILWIAPLALVWILPTSRILDNIALFLSDNFGWVVITSIAGIMCAVKQKKVGPNGVATVGLTLGIIGLIIFVISLLFFSLVFRIA